MHALFTIPMASAKHLFLSLASFVEDTTSFFVFVSAQCIDYVAVDQLEFSEQNSMQISC